jgi:membrane-associated phospholipid phosphatase
VPEHRMSRLLVGVGGGAVRVARRLALTPRGWALLASSMAATASSTVVLVAVGQDVISGDGLELRDASNLSTVLDHRSSLLVAAAKVTTEAGSVKVLVLLALLAAAVLWWRGARLVLAAAPALSLAVTGALVGVTKLIVGRGRPPAALGLVAEGGASFPSGHSSDSAAFFLVLAVAVGVVVLRRPLARAASVATAFALETAIGLSRLELGVHWPTDVIVGWALGTTVALMVSTVVVLATRFDMPQPDEHAGRVRSTAWKLWHLTQTARGNVARRALAA